MELSLSICVPYSWYRSVFLGVPYSWPRSVFLAAFRGLRCAIGLLRSSALRPTSVPNNEIAKTAAFGFGAVRKGKEIRGSGHFLWIPKPFVHPLIASHAHWCKSALKRSIPNSVAQLQ